MVEDKRTGPAPRTGPVPAAEAAGPEALWGIGQVAAYLGCGRETVRAWWQATARRAAALPPPDFLQFPDGAGISSRVTPGGAALTARWTPPGVRPLWRPTTIALWASTTGRSAVGGARPAVDRLPVPMWQDLQPLTRPLPRVRDEVLTLTGRGLVSGSVHVRVFDGPLPVGAGEAGGAVRTVVVLASPDHGLAPQSWPALIAEHLQRTGRLTPAQARRAWWFALPQPGPPAAGPGTVAEPPARYVAFAVSGTGGSAADTGPGSLLGPERPIALAGPASGPTAAGLCDPQLLPAALADIDHLIGAQLELYPPGSYTAATVAAHTAGPRPVQLDWDPAGLAADLAHLAVLTAAASAASERGDYLDATLRGTAAHWLAVRLHDHLSGDYLDATGVSGPRDAVQLVLPTPGPADLERIEQLLADPPDLTPYGAGRVMRDLNAVRQAAQLMHPVSELAAALHHAAEQIAVHYRPTVALAGLLLAGHAPVRLAVPEVGPLPEQTVGAIPDAAAYLHTISWWGPKAEDNDLAEVLSGLFFSHEIRTRLRHGYDPFGRLVLYCPGASALGVAWPLAPGAPHDDPNLPMPRPSFTALPDGRIDLQPITAPQPPASGQDEGKDED